MADLSESSGVSKVLNACDECRTRKLKCSGEPTGCLRCRIDALTCKYSPRKQMGRPRKRRREDARAQEPQEDYSIHERGGVAPVSNQAASLSAFDPLLGQELMSNGFPNVNGEDASYSSRDYVDLDSSNNNGYDLDFSQELLPETVMNFGNWNPCPDSNQVVSTSAGDNAVQPLVYPVVSNSDSLVTPDCAGYALNCTCLPDLYKSLANFQSSPPPLFPYSMAALKKAQLVGYTVVRCQQCSQEYNRAIQNSSMLGTLINLVISEYNKLLKYIDERSAKEEMIPFRIGDGSPETQGLHTGTFDCPMGIEIDLNGEEWRTLARKVVKNEIFPARDGEQCLERLIGDMRTRQLRWHQGLEGLPHPISQHKIIRDEKSDCICHQVAYIDNLRRSSDFLNL